MRNLRRNEQFRDFRSERFCHLERADVSYAVEGQVHMDRLGRGDVILDVLNDQLDQVGMRVHQNRDKQVTLK